MTRVYRVLRRSLRPASTRPAPNSVNIVGSGTTPVGVAVVGVVVVVVVVDDVTKPPPPGEKMLKFLTLPLLGLIELNAARMLPATSVSGNALAKVVSNFHSNVEPLTIGNPPPAPPPVHSPQTASLAPPPHPLAPRFESRAKDQVPPVVEERKPTSVGSASGLLITHWMESR